MPRCAIADGGMTEGRPRPAHAALRRPDGCFAAPGHALRWAPTPSPQETAPMLDKPSPLAEESLGETTERWIAAFGAALANGSARALSELFAADSHWRNLFGVSWHFATFSG